MNFVGALCQGVQGAPKYLKSKNELKKTPKTPQNTQKRPNMPQNNFLMVLTPNEFFQSLLSGGLKSPILFEIQK